MTMTVEQAAVAVRNLAKQYRAVLEVGAILDEMADLNRAKVEAENRTIDAQENQRRAEEALRATDDELAQAKLKLADARQAAEAVLKNAGDAAAEMKANAFAEATDMVEKAKASAAKVRDELERDRVAHNVAMNKKKAEYDDLFGKVEALKKALADLKERVNV